MWRRSEKERKKKEKNAASVFSHKATLPLLYIITDCYSITSLNALHGHQVQPKHEQNLHIKLQLVHIKYNHIWKLL